MGYWPSVRSRWLDIGQVLFFCVFMDRDEVEVNKHAKNERGQYPAILTEQAWSIKDLLWLKTPKNDLWSCGTKREIPSGQDSSILPAQGASYIRRVYNECKYMHFTGILKRKILRNVLERSIKVLFSFQLISLVLDHLQVRIRFRSDNKLRLTFISCTYQLCRFQFWDQQEASHLYQVSVNLL